MAVVSSTLLWGAAHATRPLHINAVSRTVHRSSMWARYSATERLSRERKRTDGPIRKELALVKGSVRNSGSGEPVAGRYKQAR